MKVKTHHEKIGKDRCFTFFIEDVSTNTLIHSSTYLVCKENKRDYNKLKNDFVSYVNDMNKMELAMLNAEVHKIKENKVKLDLENISNNSNN